ncbi:hypothetical protein N9M74_00845 [Pontimonas sp.]|nr:hypothetical protein [Pontimonas sp.]
MRTWLGVPILLVLGIPVAFAFLFDPYWFAWSGRIDPWLYWGTGINLHYFAEFFSDTYYFRRWTVTLPYALTHLLFGEALGLALLASFQLALLGLLIFWLNRSFGHSALLAASLSIFASANPFLFLAIGDGYITAPSLILISATLLLISLGSRSKNHQFARLMNAGSGFTFFLLLVTYPALIIIGPFFLFFWLNCVRSVARFSTSTAVQAGAPALTGLIVGWFLDVAVGQVLVEGGWGEFFITSFGTALGLASSGEWGVDASTLLSHLLTSPSSILWTILAVAGFWSTVLTSKAPLEAGTKAASGLLVAGIFSQFVAHLFITLTGGDALTNIKIVIFLFFNCLIAIFAILSRDPFFAGRRVGAVLLIGLPLSNIAYFFDVDVFEHYFFGLLVFLFLSSILVFLFGSLLVSRAERADQIPRLKKILRSGVIRTTSSLLGLTSFALASYLLTSAYFPSYGFSPDAQSPDTRKYFQSVGGEVRALTDSTSGGQRNRYFIWDQREWRGWSPVVSSLYGMYSSLSLDPRAEEIDCDVIMYASSLPSATFLIIGDGQSPNTRSFLDFEASRCGLQLQLVSEVAPMPYMEQFRVESSSALELKK